MAKYIPTIFYTGFFASLWYTFLQGHNIYVDRLINIMTTVYAITDGMVTFLVLILAVAVYAMKETKNFSAKPMPTTALEDFKKMRRGVVHLSYRYLGFYPATFCAGILLGNYWLFAFMLYDAVLGLIMMSQLETILEVAKGKSK